MFEGAFTGIVGFLALLGAAALALRLVRAAARVVLRAAEVAAATGVAEAGARRGDITALNEGRQAERNARAARRRSALAAAGLLLWLAVPLALGFAAEAYALAAPLWLLPWHPVRPPTGGAEQGTPPA